ncbi:hypothetical protein XI25_22600 [Paenibacillus sp. DMB20]|nr:hypothetical protein XI25_22600 [Paenibacillus sp. DMB20]
MIEKPEELKKGCRTDALESGSCILFHIARQALRKNSQTRNEWVWLFWLLRPKNQAFARLG